MSFFCGHWYPCFGFLVMSPLGFKARVGQLRIEGHFGFWTFRTKFCNILKHGMNLKFETIIQIFRKIIQLNAVIILKSINEYYRKFILKKWLQNGPLSCFVCLIRYFCGGECNVHSPRFTSGATLADLLAAGMQPVTSPHACAEVGFGSDSNMRPHEQKTNTLPLCQRPGLYPPKVGCSMPPPLTGCMLLHINLNVAQFWIP